VIKGKIPMYLFTTKMKTIQIYLFTYFQTQTHDNKDPIVELENPLIL